MRLRLAAFSTVLIGLFLLTAYAQAQSTSDSATSRPFQKELTCDMAVGGNFCSAEFTVPANSRLKLTYVNVRAALAPTGTQRAIAQFNTIFQQKQVNYAIPLSHQGIFPSQDEWVGNDMIQAIVGGGSVVNFHVQRNEQTGNAGFRVTFVGQLVQV
jgi:hypothetical protein